MARYSALTGKVSVYEKSVSTYKDINDLLAEVGEKDEEMLELISSMEEDLGKECEELRHKLLFSGEYDALNCTLEIHSGAGGTEAQDWAQMLSRMYGRFCERNNFKLQVLDMEEGDEAGIKSATIKVSGQDAYGFLKGEKGVHRLVRISPSMPRREGTRVSPPSTSFLSSVPSATSKSIPKISASIPIVPAVREDRTSTKSPPPSVSPTSPPALWSSAKWNVPSL